MPTLDRRVDAYIAKSAAFAQPILAHIRAVIHVACPEAEETLKWSMPHFQYKGMLCGMSGFKAHCALGFWQRSILFPGTEKEAMGHFGRITSIEDLPSKKELGAIIKQAMKLNDEGVKSVARAKPAAARELVVPDYLTAALKANKPAKTVFEAGSTSFRREYVDWITDAKTDATRERRMAQAIEWLAEGKARDWKYEKC